MAHCKHGRKAGAGHRRTRCSSLRNVDHLLQQFRWLFPCADIFSSVRFHGNITWTALPLVLLALCWSWSEARYVTDAFTEASGWCRILVGHSPLSTYQGFMGALTTWTPRLLPVLLTVLHQRFEQIGARFYRVHGWLPIGFDGSRSTAARTRSNQEALCAKNYGKGNTAKYRKKKSKGMRRKKNEKHPAHPQAPQAWITLMWHMGLRLPWNWRLGPSNASEREHVIDMIESEQFPRKTLFCADAGFVGYPLWSSIQKAGHHFLVRVGANVNLLTATANCQYQNQGKEIFVLCWPKAAIQAKEPPLRLRLVRVQVGKTGMWLLTNVLDRKELSRKAMARFYQIRWGIEIEFRGLKQTLGRAKLRCRNGKRLITELHWSILGMAVAELLATKEQLTQKLKGTVEKQNRSQPEKRSLANTVRALRSCLKALKQVPEPGQNLATLLRGALVDDYKRKRPKGARYRPPNPDKKSLGDPEIRQIDAQEKKMLKLFDIAKAA